MRKQPRKARKRWACYYGHDVIEPGHRYVDEVHMPWERVIDDPDDLAGEPLGVYVHIRYHDRCFMEAVYG